MKKPLLSRKAFLVCLVFFGLVVSFMTSIGTEFALLLSLVPALAFLALIVYGLRKNY